MGISIPRPAMRAREARVIRARLDYYQRRKAEIMALGTPEKEARAVAFREAQALRFNRAGKIRKQ